jgi:hypothetical protein
MPSFSTTYAVADIDADFGLTVAERNGALALITADETRDAIIRAMQDVIQKKLETVKPYPWVSSKEA